MWRSHCARLGQNKIGIFREKSVYDLDILEIYDLDDGYERGEGGKKKEKKAINNLK